MAESPEVLASTLAGPKRPTALAERSSGRSSKAGGLERPTAVRGWSRNWKWISVRFLRLNCSCVSVGTKSWRRVRRSQYLEEGEGVDVVVAVGLHDKVLVGERVLDELAEAT